jgi:acyl carrier protein
MSQFAQADSLSAHRRQALREWLAQANGMIRAEELQDDTLLIQQHIITSLQVMDLINLLEELTGRSIEVERLTPGVFASINSISRAFLEEESNGS